MPKIQARPEPTVETPGVLYPEYDVRLFVGETSLTAFSDDVNASSLLGLEWETDAVKFGPDFLFKGIDGRKARCGNNVTNRPLYWGNVESLVQTILNRRWEFNAEPVIVGEHGSILNGQHQLVALVIAQQTLDDPVLGDRWREYWPEGVASIEKQVTYGVSEEDSTVNTMDTCKPRSIMDVIYRSPYFAHLKSSDRVQAARIADNGVKTIWYRTGMDVNAFAPRRNIPEALTFLDRHPRFLEAVNHVRAEDEGDRLKRYVPPGKAAALLYLMGTSGSDGEAYRAMDYPSEEAVNFDQWERAEDLFTCLAGDSPDVQEVIYALAELVNSANGHPATPDEKAGVLVKAWDVWQTGKPFRKADPRLRYVASDFARMEDGTRKLLTTPIIGGLDVGKSDEDGGPPVPHGDPEDADTPLEEVEPVEAEDDDPTPAEIEAEQQRILDEKVAAALAPKAPKVKTNGKPAPAVDPLTGRTANNETPRGPKPAAGFAAQSKKSPKPKARKS